MIGPWDGNNTPTRENQLFRQFQFLSQRLDIRISDHRNRPQQPKFDLKIPLRHRGKYRDQFTRAGGSDVWQTSKSAFDGIGRLERQSIFVGSTERAYSRYEYPSNGIQSKRYSPIVDVDGDNNIAEDEVYSESWLDGAGRVRRSRTEHPGSNGEWMASVIEYDIVGRVARRTVRPR